MGLKIERGKSFKPATVLIYGTEGIGKSTLAAQFPSPLILDTEGGTAQIDCSRVKCPDWSTLMEAVVSLGGNAQGFETIVIDTVDWAEKALVASMLAKGGKKSIEDFGYGKGYTMLAEQFGKLLDGCEILVDRGLHVVFVAHAAVRRVSPPDMADGFDRYEMKLSKQVGPLVREWVDAQLFCTTKTRLIEGKDGRTKAAGGKSRIMYAERSAAWDAKNRFGLPEEMAMEIGQLAPMFPKPSAPQQAPRWLDRVRAATTVEQLGRLSDEADAAQSEGTLTDAQRKKLDAELIRRHDEIDAGTEPFDSAEVGAEANQ